MWFRGLRIQLVSMRMCVQSLASINGLRIRCCHELQRRSQMWLISYVAIAAWELPYGMGAALKRKKRKKKKSIFVYLDLHIFLQYSTLRKSVSSLFIYYQTFPLVHPAITSSINESNDTSQKWLNIRMTYVSTLVTGISQLHYHSTFLAFLPPGSLPYNSYCQIFLIPFFIDYSPAQNFLAMPC